MWIALSLVLSAAVTAAAATIPFTAWNTSVVTSANLYYSQEAVDASGNSYVCGYTDGSVFGGSAGAVKGFLGKYGPSGHFVWGTQIPNGRFDSITIDPTGGVYVSSGSSILKYNSAGNLQWSGGTPGDLVYGIAIDPSKNIFVAGVVGNPDNAFLSKLDSSGNVLWTRTPQTSVTTTSYPSAVAVDSSGDVIMIGQDYFNNFTASNGFAAKYDPGGNLLWNPQFGSTTDSTLTNGVAIDSKSNIYIAGEGGPLLGEPVSNMPGYLIKYDATDNQQWISRFNQFSGPMPVRLDPNGGEYVPGSFNEILKYSTTGTQVAQTPIPSSGLSDLAYNKGNLYLLNYSSDRNGFNSYLTDVVVAVVPEPSAIALLGWGCAGLLWIAFRRHVKT
ncbi:MAG TPA: SBBP repeat-containing protein [Pirellulales bacterium]|jgi:hypothetical protein|nr:SBBP repeat-containing protein [Pirellulales bacterium]